MCQEIDTAILDIQFKHIKNQQSSTKFNSSDHKILQQVQRARNTDCHQFILTNERRILRYKYFIWLARRLQHTLFAVY